MKKISFFSAIFLVLASCDFIPNIKKEEAQKGDVIAKVHDKLLFKNDLLEILPIGISETDSLLLVKGYIESWAKQQLLLHQAELNLSDKSLEFNKLVEDYHATLYINAYKQALVLDKLDTLITKEQIIDFYTTNHENFKLNEELVQLKFIHTDSGRVDKKELIKLFKSKDSLDKSNLQERALEFKSFNFNDSIWVKYSDMTNKLVGFETIDKNILLKKSKYIEKEDSLGLYLVTVKNVLKRNETAPINYVTPTIKQIILQKRKLELLRKIEVDLLNDAIKNKNFEAY
ncbi:MAG: hypothetical protein BM563_11640 [Bacteroidetes bacterium MedPE-SWsnd-G1]|nr:MAG: hypothetical protein BM563_11640 [Bacteroidetes bacterium MedPE-SWsnd-G1]